MIVSLDVRRQVRIQELLIEAQCLAGERGQADIKALLKRVCQLLTMPAEQATT